MDAVYQWAGRIVSYLVFVTILTGLLPAASYEKYLRLFAGCILILLVFRPLTEGLRLEDSIRRLFGSITFETEVKELGGQLDEMGKKRLDLFFEEYIRETEEEIKQLAESSGLMVEKAEVFVEKDEKSPDFARIRRISLECTLPVTEGQEIREKRPGAIFVNPVSGVELAPVSVRAKERKEEKNSRNTEEERKLLESLKKQLAASYQVEEAYVEIRLEAGEGSAPGQGEMDSSSD